jgi:uncharacterized membrane protein
LASPPVIGPSALHETTWFIWEGSFVKMNSFPQVLSSWTDLFCFRVSKVTRIRGFLICVFNVCSFLSFDFHLKSLFIWIMVPLKAGIYLFLQCGLTDSAETGCPTWTTKISSVTRDDHQWHLIGFWQTIPVQWNA